jgi:hypothetical protein
MAYEIRPNTGSLFVNEKKTETAQPDFQGKIVISAELIKKLASQGDLITFDVSGWKKTTGTGKNLLSLSIKEPYKKAESGDYSSSDRHNPDYTPKYKAGTPPEPTAHQQPPAPAKVAPPTSADAQRYLDKLKISIAKIEDYPAFEILYGKIHSAEVWKVFKADPAIAQQATSILSAKKGELILATAPVDLSSILSAIDVECDRLNLGKAEHCLARWNKPRAMLSHDELAQYLE